MRILLLRPSNGSYYIYLTPLQCFLNSYTYYIHITLIIYLQVNFIYIYYGTFSNFFYYSILYPLHPSAVYIVIGPTVCLQTEPSTGLCYLLVKSYIPLWVPCPAIHDIVTNKYFPLILPTFLYT